MINFFNNIDKDNSLFSNIFGFLRLPLIFNPYKVKSDWVITGVPFDMATSGRSGSRHGPTAIRQASINLAWEKCRWPWKFNLNKHFKIIDCGDLVYDFGNLDSFCINLYNHADRILASEKRMLSFGGDHFITYPLLRAYYKHFGKLSLLHFDAHTDNYLTDNKFDHGAVFYYALKENFIDPFHSIQLGIRTEHKNSPINILDADQINSLSIDCIVKEIEKIVGNLPIYLSFDIDFLDPSVAPGTGTPVIGGISNSRALSLIRGLKNLNIVGMDIVEVLPAYDYAQITALSASTLALEMLYTQCAFNMSKIRQ